MPVYFFYLARRFRIELDGEYIVRSPLQPVAATVAEIIAKVNCCSNNCNVHSLQCMQAFESITTTKIVYTVRLKDSLCKSHYVEYVFRQHFLSTNSRRFGGGVVCVC